MVQKRHRQEEAAIMNTEPRTATASHTPGPWQIRWPTKYQGYYAGGSDATIYGPDFHVTKWSVARCSAHAPNFEADACLIAAAPSMLAELRSIVELIEQDCAGEAKLTALRAIAEATGAV